MIFFFVCVCVCVFLCVISVYKINGKLWGDDIINSLICIFISTGQEMFLENVWTSKCHNFLIFQLILIKFSLFCSKIFTLSSEIKLNLFRISPLKEPV